MYKMRVERNYLTKPRLIPTIQSEINLDNQNMETNYKSIVLGAQATGGGASLTNCPTNINASTVVNITLNLSVTSLEAESSGFLSKIFRRVIKNESSHIVQLGLGENKSIEDVFATIVQRSGIRAIEN